MRTLWDLIARHQLGRPAPGKLSELKHGHYTFEQGGDLIGRIEARFGDLSRLSCLDLGAGPCETHVGTQLLTVPWRRLTSVEAFPPYVNRLRRKQAAAQRHDIAEIRIESIFEEFYPGEFDLAIMIDVLEHFRRRDALRLLVRLEHFVGRGIVIFTPLGKVEQDELDQNHLQRHLSYWNPEDWLRLGYDVEVCEGFHGFMDPPASAAWAIKSWENWRGDPTEPDRTA